MSSRDWSTIGGGRSVSGLSPRGERPPWIRWAILPPLIPLAAIAWLATHWDRIPLRFGHPLTARTPLHVFGFLIFAAGLTTLLMGLMWGVWYGSRRPATWSPMDKILLAVAYLLSLVFTSTGLSPVLSLPVWPLAVIIPLVALATIVYVVKEQGEPDDAADNTPDECWSLSGIYYNPKDPSMLVRARIGYGYTLNMANPWSYRIVIGFLGGIAALVGFLIWSLR